MSWRFAVVGRLGTVGKGLSETQDECGAMIEGRRIINAFPFSPTC